VSSHSSSGEIGRGRRVVDWLKAYRLLLSLLLGVSLLLAADVVAAVGLESMTVGVRERAAFHHQVAAARRLHISVLTAEDDWHQLMASGLPADLEITRASVAQARLLRDELVIEFRPLPDMEASVNDAVQAIDARLAEIEATGSARLSMDDREALQVVAQSDAADALGGISTSLSGVAAELEARWTEADSAAHRANVFVWGAVIAAAAVGIAVVAASSLASLRETKRRQQASLLLAQREAYNRGLIEASLDALVAVDPGLMITDVNEAMCRMCDSSREKLVGTSFPDLFTDPALAAAGMRLALDRGSVADYELELPTETGAEILVSFNAATYRDPASGLVRGIIAAARDVTEARRMQRSLADQHAYTRGLIEASVDALATIDMEGRISDVNRQMETLTGAPRGELVGSPFAELFTDPAAAAEGVRRVLVLGRVTDYELVVKGRDGREVPVSYNASTYRNAMGEVQGVFASARNVTARELALQQANRSLEAFAYSVSHDLRTPLRAMSGFAQALAEDYGSKLDATGQDYTERVQRASEHMSRLIDALLQLSKLSRTELRF
jgi:PAS domain S-box-containing protein